MKKSILISLIFFSQLIAQIDTFEYLSYFPIQIGNKWQYEITEWVGLWDTTYYHTITVSRDTIMPNGKTYYLLENFYYSPFMAKYFRIDTSTFQVLHYYPITVLDTTCSDSEIVIFELRPPKGEEDFFTTCIGYEVQIDSGFDQIGYISDSTEYLSYFWFDGLDNSYILSKEVGISHQFSYEILGYRSNLIAANVNGIMYGEFINIEDEPLHPNEYILLKNYPNPFNSTTNIIFSIPQKGYIELKVYDIIGREIDIVLKQKMDVGYHIVSWGGSDLPTGLYFISLKTSSSTKTIKTLVLK